MAVRFADNTKYATQGTAELPTGKMAVLFWVKSDGWVMSSGGGSARTWFDRQNFHIGYFPDSLYIGWQGGRQLVDNDARNAFGDTVWQPVLTIIDPAQSNYSEMRVGDLTTRVSTFPGTMTVVSATGHTRHIGVFTGASRTIDSDFEQHTIWDLSARGDFTSKELEDLMVMTPDLAAPDGIVDYVPFTAATISGSTATALVGTNATLVGSPSVVDGPDIVSKPAHTIGDYFTALAARIAEAVAYAGGDLSLKWPADVPTTPLYTLHASEGRPDTMSLARRNDGTTGIMDQAEADARWSTRLIDGADTCANYRTVLETNYDTEVGGAIPAWSVDPEGGGAGNVPFNVGKDADAWIIGVSDAYTLGQTVGAHALNGSAMHWNKCEWSGDPTTPTLAGANGYELFLGKYPASAIEYETGICCSMYGAGMEPWFPDGTNGGMAGYNTNANWLDTFPSYERSTTWKTRHALIGPIGALRCQKFKLAYPGKMFWPSFSTSSMAYKSSSLDGSTDLFDADDRAEAIQAHADAMVAMDAEGAEALWLFDPSAEQANSAGDLAREISLELVQRYNQTGPYATSSRGGIRRTDRGRAHSRRERR